MFIFVMVAAAVRNNYTSATPVKEAEIERHTIRWFQQAGDRHGGRKENDAVTTCEKFACSKWPTIVLNRMYCFLFVFPSMFAINNSVTAAVSCILSLLIMNYL